MALRGIITELCASAPLRTAVLVLSTTIIGRKLLTSLAPYRGIYGSVPEAWRAAGKRRHAGHEHPEAVDRHIELSAALMPSDYAVLYWLNRLSGPLRIFDYGGNMGNVFYTMIKYLDPSRVSWKVYDLPGVIDRAEKLAAERPGPKPQFVKSVADAANSNVILASGSYHYWEKSAAEFLDQFQGRPEHVIINRSPFYEEDRPPVVSMQSSHNFAFPIVIRPVQELQAGFSSRGYKLVDRWVAAEYSHVMPFFPKESIHRYSGFYFRRDGNAG